MATSETATTRAPRGTKPVCQAFFAALETIPDTTRNAVAKAAQAMIRDELKLRREKAKAATAKAKAKTPTVAKTAVPKPAVKKIAAKPEILPAAEAAPAKSRARKAINVPAAT